MVIVPVRREPELFADALHVTDPLPSPLPPEVTLIHESFEVAAHEQFERTSMLPEAPTGSAITSDGVML